MNTRGPVHGLILAALLACGATSARAESKVPLLHALFQDHAVLQRDQPIPVWGQAVPGTPVIVDFAGKTVNAQADAEGRWHATLPPQPAGGPHELTVRAGEAVQRVRDVQMGDVWLCAGQSNMELPVWRALNADGEIASATQPMIRLFTVPKAAAITPQTGFQAPVAWTPAAPETVRDFSAACFYFARELQKTVKVPMGLIQSAWGGSRIEAWTGTDALRRQGGMEEALDVLALSARDPAAANARWGRYWQQWWTTREGVPQGDAPWSPDAGGTGWHTAPESLGPWERWGIPSLAAYDGMVWYRTQVTLTAAQAAREATLELGAVDETDMTWVNGVAVGSQYAPGDARRYPLPPGLLKAGANTVVINVLDTWSDGGLAGPASAQALRFDDGTRAVLESPWQYRIAPGNVTPPLAPWHAATGVSTLYNGMIAPLGHIGLRGMLWYQGESNTADGAAYAARLRTLRDDWRTRFGARTPLLVAQLAGFGPPPTAPVDSGWAQVRDAQRRVVAEDPHAGLAVAIDIGDAYDIHPPNKQELGRRLARVARHVVFGETALAPSGPIARTASRTPAGVRIAFDDVQDALVATGANGPIGFELCDAEARTCAYADAVLEGRDVLLRSPQALPRARVRYCWADGPVCTLRDRAGAPAGPFELAVTEPAPSVHFDWFEYSGRDEAFEAPLPSGHYRNPILAGFHADPSIVRVNDRYYLVNSSFTYFPGIPVFESTDLVHWTQIGNVIDRPTQLDFDGLGVSRGVFAPAISYHDGTFYVVTTAVDSGGNFIATARDPAGPWSDPHWLPGIDGIDPSLFFDEDGKVYLLNNDAPAGPARYDGHRAIWMQEIDLAAFRPVGPRRVLVDGGVEPAKNPIWIEGPHLYARNGWYYLSNAEGGTGPQHSQVVLRSRNVWGPYLPYPRNPILTQRELPDERPLPITNAGHADMVEGPDGSWWAVFLASRNYQTRHYNTGRETYLLPVHWRDDWPEILSTDQSIPTVAKAPSWMQGAASQAPFTGNFVVRDGFDGPTLDAGWLRVRVPKQDWADLHERPGALTVHPLPEDLDTLRNPSFLGRRQQHLRFEASTELDRPGRGIAAGLAAFQNEDYWYFLGVRSLGGDRIVVFLEGRDGHRVTHTLASQTQRAAQALRLKITGDGGRYAFAFDTGEGRGWQTLAKDVDGTVLSTDRAGGFVGTLLGPFARDERATRSQ
jgi:sialate O-acetylesterase